MRAAVAGMLCVLAIACAAPPKGRAPIREELLVLAPEAPDAGLERTPNGTLINEDRALITDPDMADARYYAGFWKVSREEAIRADAGVLPYLRTKRPELADALPDYVAQIFGVHTDPDRGPPLVHFNFFCKSHMERERKEAEAYPDLAMLSDWQHQVIIVHDGGPCYFQLNFDPVTGTYQDLIVNGRA